MSDETTSMTDERLAEIETRDRAATQGPWQWFGNGDVRDIYLATPDRGRLYVMQFDRWGMQSAQPVFRDDAQRLMVKASQLPVYEVAPSATRRDDPRVYRADISGLRNADAEFIAASRQDVTDLLAEVRRLRAQVADLSKTPADRANEHVRALRESGDIYGALAMADYYETEAARHV